MSVGMAPGCTTFTVRLYDVYRDVAGAEVSRDASRVSGKRCLRTRVVGDTFEGYIVAEQRADKDDPAAICQFGRCGAGVRDRAQDIDLPLSIVLVLVEAGIVDLLPLDRDAGVVHEDVELAEFIDHGVDQELGRSRVGLVALDRDCANTLSPESFNDSFSLVG
jgi:hypothetical protein